MQSFVVQNFNTIYPITEKNQNHIYINLLSNKHFIHLFIVQLATTTKFNHSKFNLLKVLNYSLTKVVNTQLTNFTLSLKYATLSTLYNVFTGNYTNYATLKNNVMYSVSPKYTVNVFYKTKLNYTTLFLINLLLNTYYNWFNAYSSSSPITYITHKHYFLPFLNLFYFKIRN